jgi:Tfp pilus assembly protein PilN
VPNKKKEISLLPQSENPDSFSSRLINWLTTVGRFIVVFTELIVISAFLSRFYLDRKNSDLSEKIRNNKAILEYSLDFEKDFRLLQQKMQSVSVLDKSNQDLPKLFDQISYLVPPNVVLNRLNVKENKNLYTLTIAASCYDQDSLYKFLSRLKTRSGLSRISIEKIEKQPKMNLLDINLTIDIPKTST